MRAAISSLYTAYAVQLLYSLFCFRVMCVQYWPAAKNREEVYGGVGITVEQEEQLANFMIRTIRYPIRYVPLELGHFILEFVHEALVGLEGEEE